MTIWEKVEPIDSSCILIEEARKARREILEEERSWERGKETEGESEATSSKDRILQPQHMFPKWPQPPIVSLTMSRVSYHFKLILSFKNWDQSHYAYTW